MYVDLLQRSADAANELARGEEIIRLGSLALEMRSRTKSPEALNDLSAVIHSAAKAHRDGGRLAESVEALKQCIEIRRPAYEAAPWHWYLHDKLGGDYYDLADTHHLDGDHLNEVLALREYLKLIIGPWWSTPIDADVDPARPTDEPEAERLRALIKTAIGPGKKSWTLMADFDGIKYPYSFDVTNVTWPKHPLEDQARWLKEVRGGTIPKAVMDSFEQMNKVAHDTKRTLYEVSNETYARTDNNKPFEIQTLGKAADAKSSPEKSAGAALAELQTRLVQLKVKVSEAPTDPETVLGAAAPFEDFGQRQLKAGEARDGAEALSEAVRFRETLVRLEPAEADHRQKLAATLTWLGKAHVQLKDYAAALNCFVRRLDLLEQLPSDSDSTSQEAMIAETHMMFGEVAEVRGDRAEALNWYVRATQEESDDAATRLAILIRNAGEMAELLPADLKAVYRHLVKGRTPASLPGFVVTFPEAIKKASEPARLAKQAARWHDRAAAHEAKKETDGFRAALTKEYETREKKVSLDGTRSDAKTAQLETALRLSRSYLEAKQMSDAALWTERAGELGHPESLLQFADWCDKGEIVKADTEKAARYRYFGHRIRGDLSFSAQRYEDALDDFAKACAFPLASGYDFDLLGQCYGKLMRWDEAVAAYTRAVEFDLKSEKVTGYIENLLEALICADRPERLSEFVKSVQAKGWELPKAGDEVARSSALFHGFQAIALAASGKDASEPLRAMREFTGKPDFKVTGWTWDELERWLKTTKLAPDRKAAAEKILTELKGNAQVESER
jgi:tetratricopeptide (TPR) repeat protein